MNRSSTSATPIAHLNTGVLWPSIAAIILGAFLVFGTGFAQPSALHNAAHDGRHSLAFPCH